MNIIYLTGAPRCGKTTLANKIAKEHECISVLSLDALSKSVRNTFSDFKLYSENPVIQPDLNRDKFLSLAKAYADCFVADYPCLTLIIEGCHFMPDEFLSVYPNAEIIALGINSGVDTALKAVNTSDWMKTLDENIKLEYAKKIFEYSAFLKSVSASHQNYTYFDRSKIDYDKVEDLLYAKK